MSRGTRSGSRNAIAAFSRSREVIVFGIVSPVSLNDVLHLARDTHHVSTHRQFRGLGVATDERLDQFLMLMDGFTQATLLAIEEVPEAQMKVVQLVERVLDIPVLRSAGKQRMEGAVLRHEGVDVHLC